jgi:putative glutathione S-transferase
VNLVRHLKQLTDIISLSVVKPYPKDGGGWRFPSSNEEYPGATVDHLFGSKFLSEVYFKDDKEYKGKYSVPLLWDKKQGRIVNNESAEMLRWLPDAFNGLLEPSIKEIELYPEVLREEIDEYTPWIQSLINSGV